MPFRDLPWGIRCRSQDCCLVNGLCGGVRPAACIMRHLPRLLLGCATGDLHAKGTRALSLTYATSVAVLPPDVHLAHRERCVAALLRLQGWVVLCF